MELFDQDGFITSFFYYLWAHDPIQQTIPSVLIPDTIIFHNSSPSSWYFTHEGQVKLKAKSKLNKEYLYKHFTKKQARSGVIALWITINQEEQCVYEYLDQNRLEDFLWNNDTMRQGVLQKFLEPKGPYNFTIRAIWGTKLCFFEKCINKYRLDDGNIDIYQKVLTYEVDKTQQVTEPLVGRVITQKIENQISNIVDHIQSVTLNRFHIQRLILNYRIDQEDRLYLLGCSSIRINDKQSKGFHPRITRSVFDVNMDLKLPEYLDLKRLALQNQFSCQKDQSCQKCDKKLNLNDLYPVKIKQIIESWNFDHIGKTNTYESSILSKRKEKSSRKSTFYQMRNDGKQHSISPFQGPSKSSPKKSLSIKGLSSYDVKQNELQIGLPLEINKNYKIPELIRKILPRLKEAKYLDLIDNPGFLEIQVNVCQECFFLIDKGVNVKEDVSKMAQQEKLINLQFFGTGNLNPEIINARNQITRRDILNKDKEQIPTQNYLQLKKFNTKSVHHHSKSAQLTQIIFQRINSKILIPILHDDNPSRTQRGPSTKHESLKQLDLIRNKIFYYLFKDFQQKYFPEGSTTTRFNQSQITNIQSRKTSMAELKNSYKVFKLSHQ